MPHKAPSINRVSRTLPAWLLLSEARVGRLLLGTEWVPARTLLKSVRSHPTRTSGKLARAPFSRERLGLRYASGWRRDLVHLFPSSFQSSQRQEARRQALEEPPCAWLQYIQFGRNEDIRFSGMVGGGTSTLSFPSFQWKEWRPASVERVEGGPPHSIPLPFKEKSAILHSYGSFRTLTFQLPPNAFARGLYEAIENLQQSAMESILNFGNFWKLI